MAHAPREGRARSTSGPVRSSRSTSGPAPASTSGAASRRWPAVRRRHPPHRRAVARDRPSPRPAGVPMELVLNAYTLGTAVPLGGPARPGASASNDRRPGAARRRPAGLGGARRAERRLHRRLPPRERPAAPPRPAAPAEHARRAGRGTRRRPGVRRRGPRGARHRRRDGRRLRRRAVRRVAGRAAQPGRGPARTTRASARTGTFAAGSTSACWPDELLRGRSSSTLLRRTRSGRVGRRRLDPTGRRLRHGVPAGLPGRRDRATGGAHGGRRSPSGCPRCCSRAARRSHRCWWPRRSRRSWPSRRTRQTLMQTLAALLRHDGSAKHAAEPRCTATATR